jgi:cell division protein FtsI (penicillin-binding protein 3)
MPIFSRTRAAVILIAIALLMGVLIGRVAYLQTYGRQRTIRSAERQHMASSVWYARRGTIFDTHGNLLAGTIQTQTLFVDPTFMRQAYQDGDGLVKMDDDVAKLARLLDREPFELSKLLSQRHDGRYVIVANDVSDSMRAAIEKLNLPGVGFTPTSERYYPMGSLGAHVLGDVGADGHGLEGLELEFNKLLAGRNGYQRTMKDARRRPIAVAADDYVPPHHGEHLILTLDANIQMIAEQELDAACEKFKAKRGEVVVMDPRTGAVLALGNWPTFNPQTFQDASAEARRDRCVTDPYEPGSTFKPFIVGPAIMWGDTRADTVFPVHGSVYRTPYGRRISDVHGFNNLAVWDILVKSSNIGMSMLGEKLGNPTLFKAITSFGFGKPTGIELPGEDSGRIKPLPRWTKYSTESVAQGYEVMITPLQLTRAFCAYANGGYLVKPHVVKGAMDPDGQIVQHYPHIRLEDLPHPINGETAQTIRRILCDVVIRGTTTNSTRSTLYNIFGKTGTSYISEGKKGYSSTRYNSSFVCGAPYEDPKIVVAVIIHEPDPKLGHYGGTVSGPPARRIIDRALTYMQVPPSPDLPLPPPQVAAVLQDYNPNLYKKPKSRGQPVRWMASAQDD